MLALPSPQLKNERESHIICSIASNLWAESQPAIMPDKAGGSCRKSAREGICQSLLAERGFICGLCSTDSFLARNARKSCVSVCGNGLKIAVPRILLEF